MIRVCLVEDQTLVRQGIKTLLELVDDIDVVAEAKDGDEALRVIPAAKPDVVLLDMCLPKRNRLEALKELKQSESLPPTLILTTFAIVLILPTGQMNEHRCDENIPTRAPRRAREIRRLLFGRRLCNNLFHSTLSKRL